MYFTDILFCQSHGKKVAKFLHLKVALDVQVAENIKSLSTTPCASFFLILNISIPIDASYLCESFRPLLLLTASKQARGQCKVN